MSTNELPKGSSEGTVPVDEAKKNAENWAVYLDKNPDQKFNVRSYYIPIVSFQNLINNNPDAEAVRIYIGLSDAEDPASSRLFLVPIIDGHEKLFRLTPPGDPNLPGDPRDDSNVYDMTKPCPPDCGNGGGGPGGGEKLGR